MRTLSHAIIFALLTALGLAGVAEAREHGRGDGFRQGRPSAGHVPAGSFENRVDRRTAGQRARIRRGARSGRLTRSELARLGRDQGQIARLGRHLGADGDYSRHDRRVIKRALTKADQRIHRATHNRRHARGRHPGKHLGWRKPHRWHKRRGHRHVAYPVYVDTSTHSHSLEVEFDGVRFAWAESR